MKPDFRTLPEVSGSKTHRWMGTTQVDAEEYSIVGWFQNNRGDWIAPIEGLRNYSALVAKRRQERITAARTRREADDAWSAEVERMVDRTP